MDLQKIKENIVKVILQFSIPSIIAMVLTSLITVVDGFFIGNYVGKEGVAAVNLGLPIVYFYLGIGLMFGVGGIAIAGMALGAGKMEECNNVFNLTIVSTFISTVLLSVVTFLGFDLLLGILKAEGKVAVYFKEYYTVMLFQLPIMVLNSCFGMFIRGEGNPEYFMKVNILNVLVNIVLDYVFSRWMHWGTVGIAVASLIAALLTLLCIIVYFMKQSKVYKFHKFIFDGSVLTKIILNGSSEFIGEISSCISMFAYNFVIMRRIGVDGVTAFTIVGYIAYIFSMITIGFGQGASPLISFTYGAKEYRLAISIRKKTNLFVFGVGIVTILSMTIGSEAYSSLFIKSEEIKDMVQSGMAIYMSSFLFAGINTISSFYFTSIGKAKESEIISGSRGLIVLVACILILPIFFGMTGIWLAAPLTEVITILFTILFMYKRDRSLQDSYLGEAVCTKR